MQCIVLIKIILNTIVHTYKCNTECNPIVIQIFICGLGVSTFCVSIITRWHLIPSGKGGGGGGEGEGGKVNEQA